jgi:hypothetical protein
MNQSDGGEHATRLAAIFPLRASQGGAMADIPTDSLPAVVGDDAYQKTLRELRADFAEQYEAWLLVAREAIARPTMGTAHTRAHRPGLLDTRSACFNHARRDNRQA